MEKIHFVLAIILFVNSGPNLALGKEWGSSISPELIAYCKKAGGTAYEFGCTHTDTCELYLMQKKSKEPLMCGLAITADCDCGPKKCLKNDKCIPNPD